MNKEKFLKLLNNCIQMKSDNSIFYYYNKNIDRQLKLNKLLNQKKEININLDEKKKDILFEQELKNKILWINYYHPFYGDNYYETKNMIEEWLNETTKWREYSIIITPYSKAHFDLTK